MILFELKMLNSLDSGAILTIYGKIIKNARKVWEHYLTYMDVDPK